MSFREAYDCTSGYALHEKIRPKDQEILLHTTIRFYAAFRKAIELVKGI